MNECQNCGFRFNVGAPCYCEGQKCPNCGRCYNDPFGYTEVFKPRAIDDLVTPSYPPDCSACESETGDTIEEPESELVATHAADGNGGLGEMTWEELLQDILTMSPEDRERNVAIFDYQADAYLNLDQLQSSEDGTGAFELRIN